MSKYKEMPIVTSKCYLLSIRDFNKQQGSVQHDLRRKKVASCHTKETGTTRTNFKYVSIKGILLGINYHLITN